MLIQFMKFKYCLFIVLLLQFLGCYQVSDCYAAKGGKQGSANLTASPEEIQVGGSSVLTWTTTNCYYVTISTPNNPGQSPSNDFYGENGSIEVFPTQTTEYFLSASSIGGGTLTSSVIVTVTDALPTVTLGADPTTIFPGESTTLTWLATDTTQASIDNGVGPVPVIGSIDVSPVETTTYAITVTGPNGTTSASTTITVQELPESPPPINVQTRSVLGGIKIYWTPSSRDSQEFRIYKRTRSGAYDLQNYISTTSSSYTDANIQPGTIYYYKVTAVDSHGTESTFSNETADTQLEEKVSDLESISVSSEPVGYGAMGDINGDGLKDIALGFPSVLIKQGKNIYDGKVEVHLSEGSKGGFNVITLKGQIRENDRVNRFGDKIVLTDLNNDGFDDVIVSDPRAYNDHSNAGRVYVYAGGESLDSTPVVTIKGSYSRLYWDGSYWCNWGMCSWGEELGTSLAAGGRY